MTEQGDIRDQIADLRRRALRSLSDYTGGFADLERVNRSLKEIVFTLDNLIDSPWTQTLITLWSRLEIPYACALSENRTDVGPLDEQDIRDAVATLLAEFRRYEIPLRSDDRPREYDVVRLCKPLPENGIAAGTTGTVVADFWTESTGGLPADCLIEFADPDGITQALITVSGADLDVVWRPGYSPLDRGR